MNKQEIPHAPTQAWTECWRVRRSVLPRRGVAAIGGRETDRQTHPFRKHLFITISCGVRGCSEQLEAGNTFPAYGVHMEAGLCCGDSDRVADSSEDHGHLTGLRWRSGRQELVGAGRRMGRPRPVDSPSVP